MGIAPTLDQQRAAFCQRRFLATPLAGLIAWSVIGIGSLFLGPRGAMLLVYFATGAIVYLAMALSRLTGEQLFQREWNPFDRLFFVSMFTSLLVFPVVILFGMVEPRAVTLGVGILTGFTWMTFSWIIQHWIGYLHAVVRTVLIVAGWLLFPAHHLQVVPAIIVLTYVLTIAVLERRWRKIRTIAPE
jgi:hypothetical protein